MGGPGSTGTGTPSSGTGGAAGSTTPIPGAGTPGAAPGTVGESDFGCSGGPMGAPTPRRLWRLSPRQYANTVAVALTGKRAAGAAVAPPAGLTVPLEPLGDEYRFKSFSGIHSVTNFEFGQSVTATQEIGRKLVAAVGTGTCWPTATTGAAADACIDTVIKDKGEILFRRPLTPEEVMRYGGLARTNTAMFGRDEALSIAFQAMLMAPQFLFLTEIGSPVAGSPTLSKLGPYEIAAAISYSLTDAPADAMLWEAASKNALSTPEQIGAQVTRLLDAPAATTLRQFVVEYFKLDRVLGISKAIEKPGEYARDRVMQDASLLIDNVLAANRRKDFLKTLLSTSVGYAGADSYKLYGLAADPKSTSPVMLNAAQRSGLLTQPAFLAAFAAFEETFPIKRGKFMNEGLLCREIPEVPIDVVAKLPASNSTMREKLAVHSNEARCAACHSLLDPMGLAFEQYDAYGRYRTTQFGKTIDPSGMLTGTGDADGPFKDAVELTKRLSASGTAERCMVRHTFRFFMGRGEDGYDSCTLDAAAKAYRAGSGDLVAAVGSLFTSPSFLNRSL